MPKSIYNNERRYNTLYRKIFVEKQFDISDANRVILEDFLSVLKSEGLTLARRFKYLYFFKNLIAWLDKDIILVDKEDLIRLVGEIKSQNYSEETKRDYISAVKKFYKSITILPKYEHLSPLYHWLYDLRNTLYSTKMDRSKNKNKEQWLTIEEVMRIIEACRNYRDKCFFSLLATQGTRPQELMELKKNDVSEIKQGLQLKVAGKTGVRDLFVYDQFAVHNTVAYLKSIPVSQEYLFEISYQMMCKVLKKASLVAGINKRVYLYKFRKFAVTKDRINGMSTGAMEQKFGWVKGTKVISVYDKSMSIDYQKESRRMAGLEDKGGPILEFKKKSCARCQHENNFERSHCEKCGLLLSISSESYTSNLEKDLVNLNKRMEKFERFIDWLEKNPDIQSTINAKTRE